MSAFDTSGECLGTFTVNQGGGPDGFLFDRFGISQERRRGAVFGLDSLSHPLTRFVFVGEWNGVVMSGEIGAEKSVAASDGLTTLSTDDAVLDGVPVERLEQEISGFASRIASATAAWLVWIAAYDRRQGWASWGTKSCAHWLNWQCGMSPRTAREHVAVARKLEEAPLTRQAFLDGELSFSKVRAICRVVVPHNEAELVDMARLMTASQLDALVGKMAPNDPDGDTTPCDVTFVNNGDGTMSMTVTAPVADMQPVKKAVRSSVSGVIDREHIEGESKTETIERLGGMKQLRSITTCQTLTGTLDAPSNVVPTVLVVADIEALSGDHTDAESTVESTRVDPAVVQRLACDSKIQTALVNGEGCELATGSEQRIVPRALRRLLLRRDHGTCQFPGCESDHRLHAHHIVHWANGGPTELWNLISVCDFHHHQLHEGGWNITTTTDGFTFIDPAGMTHRVPVMRLPSKNRLPKKSGAAAPLSGLGERTSIDEAADIIMSNTVLREQRAAQT